MVIDMRLILVFLAIAFFLIASLPLYFILWIIGKFNPDAKNRMSQKIIAGAFRFVLFFAGTKWTVLGLNNVPKNEAVLYAANHRGFADIPIAYITLPTPTGFVAKKQMTKVPLFSWWMKNLKCLLLDRDNMRESLKTILQGVEYMKQGHSIFIMPEGTRNQSDELLTFKEGSLKMAEKTGCAIIPVAISNTDAVFERQQPWVKKAHVIIHYGKPIYPNDLPKEERKALGVKVRGIIEKMLAEDKPLI